MATAMAPESGVVGALGRAMVEALVWWAILTGNLPLPSRCSGTSSAPAIPQKK